MPCHRQASCSRRLPDSGYRLLMHTHAALRSDHPSSPSPSPSPSPSFLPLHLSRPKRHHDHEVNLSCPSPTAAPAICSSPSLLLRPPVRRRHGLSVPHTSRPPAAASTILLGAMCHCDALPLRLRPALVWIPSCLVLRRLGCRDSIVDRTRSLILWEHALRGLHPAPLANALFLPLPSPTPLYEAYKVLPPPASPSSRLIHSSIFSNHQLNAIQHLPPSPLHPHIHLLLPIHPSINHVRDARPLRHTRPVLSSSGPHPPTSLHPATHSLSDLLLAL